MPLPITLGLGHPGAGGASTLLTTLGYGKPSSTPCAAFLAETVQPFYDHLIVTFNSPFSASGPALRTDGYSIENADEIGIPIEVLEIVPDGSNSILRINTTIHTVVAEYILHMPELGLVADDGRPFNGAFELPYTSVELPVNVQLTRSLDARTFEVVFDRAVYQEDAENIANYQISPPLRLLKAKKITDYHYRLTTEQQVIDLVYDVTVTGIR
jgi:hypothetical protein